MEQIARQSPPHRCEASRRPASGYREFPQQYFARYRTEEAVSQGSCEVRSSGAFRVTAVASRAEPLVLAATVRM